MQHRYNGEGNRALFLMKELPMHLAVFYLPVCKLEGKGLRKQDTFLLFKFVPKFELIHLNVYILSHMATSEVQKCVCVFFSFQVATCIAKNWGSINLENKRENWKQLAISKIIKYPTWKALIFFLTQ